MQRGASRILSIKAATTPLIVAWFKRFYIVRLNNGYLTLFTFVLQY